MLVLLLGCDSSIELTSTPDYVLPENSVLLPLDSGNVWVYQSYISNFGSGSGYSLDTSLILGDTTFAGSRWSRVQMRYMYNSGLMTHRRDGIYSWTDHSIKYFSLIRGDSIYFPVTGIESVRGWYIKLVSTQTVITVPAGTCTCVEYHEIIDGPGTVGRRYYFAPNVGLVRKSEYGWATGRQNHQADLATCHLAR